MKKRTGLYAALIAVVLLAGALWVFGFGPGSGAVLRAREKVLAPEKPVLVCRVVNRSGRWLYYENGFYVERWNEDTSAWEYYKESSRDVNSDMALRYWRPFSAKTEEYPVWLYADSYAPGRYRVVQYAGYCGGLEEVSFPIPDEAKVVLYGEFTVEDVS